MFNMHYISRHEHSWANNIRLYFISGSFFNPQLCKRSKVNATFHNTTKKKKKVIVLCMKVCIPFMFVDQARRKAKP